jgi:hypothetical protein
VSARQRQVRLQRVRRQQCVSAREAAHHLSGVRWWQHLPA